ncbi:MAG: SUMF1/EgtB/PvdO family nonheme iron enzyme [Bacteroidota bacterium]
MASPRLYIIQQVLPTFCGRCLLIFSFLMPGFLMGSNVALRDAKLLTENQLQVSLRWEQSWSLADGRHDAIWLFAKYRPDANSPWQHLKLSSDSLSHVADIETLIQPVADEMGVMIRPSQTGSGLIDWQTLTLELAQALPLGTVDLAVYAIEMAYVVEGPYWLGDSTSFHHFRDSEDDGAYWVANEGTIPEVDWSTGDEATIAGDMPAVYPKGTEGFYLMKYELSQAQYRDFLNSLSYVQQLSRFEQIPYAAPGTQAMVPAGLPLSRNGIVIEQSGAMPNIPAVVACDVNAQDGLNGPADGQTRACNFLNWADLLAYLDWAGLSPLTELAFEKACRGPLAPVRREFAWGTAAVIDANTVVDDGTPQESVTEQATPNAGIGAHGYTGPDGPLRNGFATHAMSDRLQSGAGYYGHLELSGNLWELCIGVDSLGLLFTGAHGDGVLDSNGDANVAGWYLNGGGIHRGGAFFSGIFGEFRDLAVSDRFYHDLHPSQRRKTTGGRGVRWMGR